MSKEEQDQHNLDEAKAFRNRLNLEITHVGGLLAMLATYLRDAKAAPALKYMDSKILSLQIDFTKLKAKLIEYEAACETVDELSRAMTDR